LIKGFLSISYFIRSFLAGCSWGLFYSRGKARHTWTEHIFSVRKRRATERRQSKGNE